MVTNLTKTSCSGLENYGKFWRYLALIQLRKISQFFLIDASRQQSRILRDCVEVEDLRSECDPLDEKSLAQFFLRVTARRLELEKLL